MSILNTKHEKKSFTITTVLLLLLLLIMFYAGMSYLDPPIPNGGISVNLGYMDQGSGNVQPLEKIKSQPQPTPTPPTPQEVVPEETEEVLTSEDVEAPVIPTEKETPKEKPIEKPKETLKEEPKKVEPKPDPKPSKETTNALNSIINGPTSNGTSSQSEGDGTEAGDKGQENGDPYAASYYGAPGTGSGGGRGWGLNGRGRPTNGKVVQDCNESGTVVVQIVVNRAGNVVKATPGVKGTTNNNPCLLEPAKQTALTYKWPSDSKAPAQQVGFIVVNFRLGE
ncbi:hypothetical protein SAMN05216480_101621 [Pustulibacterium marinum]|uniref:Protein TonB, links inner and outer membranes n=1 Tax=Pustulibacterium marinum TaxID=1224947 RepID=A0A1I7F494_9FLAO|nr:energy transducer TonB [Pustulibacterium marinum]SFU31048.1 hypothetical protein SAMN05216480_101621 [Pustulibacterium marinum]